MSEKREIDLETTDLNEALLRATLKMYEETGEERHLKAHQNLKDGVVKPFECANGSGIKKSNHKHIYEPCVISYPDDWWNKAHLRRRQRTPIFSSYCPVCGKIGYLKDQSRWYNQEPVMTGNILWTRTVLNDEGEREMNPRTRTLPYFEIDDPFVKFVEIKE